MTDHPPTAARPTTAPIAASCEVRAAGLVVRYRRVGTGRPLLALPADGDDAHPWPALVNALAARYRVVVPEPPAGMGDPRCWLAPFLEGLGARGMPAVVDVGFADACLELAANGSDQLARVVVLPGDGGAGRVDGNGRAGRARHPSVPQLWLPAGLDAGATLALVVPFLAGDAKPDSLQDAKAAPRSTAGAY